MEPAEAEQLLAALPPVHVALLVLRAAGACEQEISERLGVTREAVAGMTELAVRKARRLLGTPQTAIEDD